MAQTNTQLFCLFLKVTGTVWLLCAGPREAEIQVLAALLLTWRLGLEKAQLPSDATSQEFMAAPTSRPATETEILLLRVSPFRKGPHLPVKGSPELCTQHPPKCSCAGVHLCVSNTLWDNVPSFISERIMMSPMVVSDSVNKWWDFPGGAVVKNPPAGLPWWHSG